LITNLVEAAGYVPQPPSATYVPADAAEHGCVEQSSWPHVKVQRIDLPGRHVASGIQEIATADSHTVAPRGPWTLARAVLAGVQL
jgi:hypothetical protein